MKPKKKNEKKRYQDIPAYELEETQYLPPKKKSPKKRKREEKRVEDYEYEDLSGFTDLSDIDDSDDLDNALARLPAENLDYEEEPVRPVRSARSVKPAKVKARKPQKNHNQKKIVTDKEAYHKPKRKSLIIGIQLITTVIFIASLLLLNILPIPFLVILIVIALLLLWGNKKRIENRRFAFGTRMWSLILSALFLVISFYSVRTYLVMTEITKGNESKGVQVTREPFGLYISGIDVYGDIEQKSRSDVNLLTYMNPKSHQMVLITTPRDYYVTIPGVSGEDKDKLTHAGLYGAGASADALANLYGTAVPFNVRFNFSSFMDIVDALGGITVESEIAFTTSPDSGEVVDIVEGKNHLNGKEALAFTRERQNLEDGDNQRGKNQQIAIKGILKKMMSPAILLHGNKLLTNLPKQVQTNMSRSEVQGFIRGYLGGILRWKNENLAATGSGSSEYCYSYSGGPLYVTIPDEQSVEEIKAEIARVYGNN